VASAARLIGASKHVVAAIAALLVSTSTPAFAAAPPEWTQKADEIAAPWPGLQEAEGRFRDYVIARDPGDHRDDYGDPMLGYGLLQTAVRTGDGALADSALRALEYSLDRAARSPSTQVFHQLAVVSSYNIARARYASHPVFQRARARWEDVLRRIEVYRIGKRAITNKSIVEAVLLLELTRSGLSSDVPGSALADRSGTLAAVRRFLSTDLPRAAKPYERGGLALLGDMPLLPPSYHALSIGVLARAIELLGSEAPGAARSLLRRATDASVATVAPDGEAAYHGRSQSQAWTLTLAAHGAVVAAAPLRPSTQRALYHGLARRAIGRLAASYPTGPEGFLVTPSFAQSIDAAIPGVDEYVAAASYTGLTLASLEWAIAAAPEIAATRPRAGSVVVGTGTGSWATSRYRNSWFAVKRARTSVRDLRYDTGLVAIKVLRGSRWRDAMPLRPRTLKGDQSAGPVLSGGGVPELTELRAASGGRVIGRGGFRTRGGRWLRRGVTFTFAPTPCGARMSWNARKGDRYTYSGFFAGEPAIEQSSVDDGPQVIEFDQRIDATEQAGYSSASDARLTRVTARFTRSRAGTATIEICG
jgi:hypothetical protein